jgi:hypothetical protein
LDNRVLIPNVSTKGSNGYELSGAAELLRSILALRLRPLQRIGRRPKRASEVPPFRADEAQKISAWNAEGGADVWDLGGPCARPDGFLPSDDGCTPYDGKANHIGVCPNSVLTIFWDKFGPPSYYLFYFGLNRLGRWVKHAFILLSPIIDFAAASL